MSTRGDLYIITKDHQRHNGAKETNRYKLYADAYIDDAGMRHKMAKAVEMKKSMDNKDVSVTIDSALLHLYPTSIVIQNLDREGGYTYILDLTGEEAIITYGYSGGYGNTNNDSWMIETSLDAFIESTDTEDELISKLTKIYKAGEWDEAIDNISVLTLNTVAVTDLIAELMKQGAIKVLRYPDDKNSIHTELTIDTEELAIVLSSKGYVWEDDTTSTGREELKKVVCAV